MEVGIYEYCFQLDDMSDIKPFWEWIERRIQPNRIYTEPEDFKAIMKGLKTLDDNKYLIIGELFREIDSLRSVPCTYKGQTVDIIDFHSIRLSDHRFKVMIDFWEPEGWPNKYLWDYFNIIVKDLSNDYPDVKKSLRNSELGFDYEELDDKQKSEMFGIVEDTIGNKNTSIINLKAARKPPGRKHLSEDIWAYREVNLRHRRSSEVYNEWIKLKSVLDRNLQEPERHFRKITQLNWLKE